MRALAAILLLTSCPPATTKAGFERVAAGRLELCVQNNQCYFLPQCFEESRQFCLDAGYAKECGQMELEGSCGVNVK